MSTSRCRFRDLSEEADITADGDRSPQTLWQRFGTQPTGMLSGVSPSVLLTWPWSRAPTTRVLFSMTTAPTPSNAGIGGKECVTKEIVQLMQFDLSPFCNFPHRCS